MYSNAFVYLSDEGVYVDSNGRPTKDIQLQWGEVPSSIGKFTACNFVVKHCVSLSSSPYAMCCRVSVVAFENE